MRKLSIFLIIIFLMANAISTNAATVPRESAPCNATKEAIVIVESFIGDISKYVTKG